jgi:probable biosynthetic protein (TIGR04099 family)
MPRHDDPYRAGMPQLNCAGLSENWLLKECGDRHWDALARETASDFISDEGSRAYAAFTSIRLRADGMQDVRENDALRIRTELSRVAPVRHLSEHRVSGKDGTIAALSMMSTFVRRTEARNNRSVARASFANLKGEIAPMNPLIAGMHDTARKLRLREAAASIDGIGLREAECAPVEFLPCPYSDFNGADFLYFASFQAFVDRAEWHTWRLADLPALVSRELHYHGNIDVGEALRVTFRRASIDEARIAHWCEIERTRDGVKIADVLTHKTRRRA